MSWWRTVPARVLVARVRVSGAARRGWTPAESKGLAERSTNWVDPHFVSRFERREELRLTDRLARVLTRERRELDPGAVCRSQAGWLERDLPGRAHLRLL